jgi:hypothetical protein
MNQVDLRGKSLKVSWGRHQQNRGSTQLQQTIQQQHMLNMPNMGNPMYGNQYFPGQFPQPPFIPRMMQPGALPPPGSGLVLPQHQQQQQLQQQQPQGPNNLTLDGMGYTYGVYYPPNHGPQ